MARNAKKPERQAAPAPPEDAGAEPKAVPNYLKQAQESSEGVRFSALTPSDQEELLQALLTPEYAVGGGHVEGGVLALASARSLEELRQELAGATIITGQIVYTQTIAKGGLYTPAVLVSKRRKRVDALVRNSGAASYALVRVYGAGVPIEQAREYIVISAATNKADGVELWIDEDPATGWGHVAVTLTDHVPNDAGPRNEVDAVIRDVFEPGTFDNLLGKVGVGAPLGEGEPGGGGGGLDEATTRRIVKEEIEAALGINSAPRPNNLLARIRPHIREVTTGVVVDEGVLRARSSSDEKFAILRSNIQDGAYQALQSWFGKPGAAVKAAVSRLRGLGGRQAQEKFVPPAYPAKESDYQPRARHYDDVAATGAKRGGEEGGL